MKIPLLIPLLALSISARCIVSAADTTGDPTRPAPSIKADVTPTEAAAIRVASEKIKDQIGEKAWADLLTHLRTINQNIQTKGIQYPVQNQYGILTGYDYGQVYDWDSYFENIYMAYNGVASFCYGNIDGFLAIQKPDGFIRRSFGPKNYGYRHHFKPFLAQLALLGEGQQKDLPWLTLHYPQIVKYLERWAAYDTDGNGLAYYTGGADHAGMDNQFSRCVGKSEGVDLNCYLIREYQSMALLALGLGKTADATAWTAKAEALKQRINDLLWDETDGLYYDRDENTGMLTKTKSVSCFTPLWTGVASPEQARRMITEHLANPKEFWSTYPVASYALTQKDYYVAPTGTECNWRGCTWIPTNYIIFHGLIRYGYKDLARQLAYQTLALALANPTTREFYDSKTGAGYGRDPFWGWSSLAYIMPFEYELGLDPTAINEKPHIPPLVKLLGVSLNLPAAP